MSISNELNFFQRAHYREWLNSGVWLNRTVADEALQWAEKCPNDVAIYLEDGSTHSYARIAEDALALAAAMQRAGLQRGDVVSFQVPNWVEVAAIDIACAYLRLIMCPIIPIYRSKELQFILKASGSRLHITPDVHGSNNYRDMLEGFRAELAELRQIIYLRPTTPTTNDYPAFIESGRGHKLTRPATDGNAVKMVLYTSGTTGVPKGVLTNHNSYRHMLDNTADFWRLTRDDVVLMPSPVTHTTGLGAGIEMPFYRGSKLALMEKWNAEAAVDFINHTRASISICATPFLVELVAAARRRHDGLPSMRLFPCGGAAVPPAVIESVRAGLANCKAFRVYGATETPMITQGFIESGEEELGATTDGRILGYEVKIVDDVGRTLPQGEEGEILARGPGMLMGYADPAHNAEAFDAEGYWRTGDLGRITRDNAIIVTGRKKDLIIRGGENLSAKEIEDVILGQAGVREVAVVSMPHPRLGEGVCAFVVATDPASAPTVTSVAEVCEKAGLAKQKWPERVEVMPALPKTPTGKVKKNELRDKARSLV